MITESTGDQSRQSASMAPARNVNVKGRLIQKNWGAKMSRSTSAVKEIKNKIQ